jgi:uncharacterized protein YyaL (SSP411 family)
VLDDYACVAEGLQVLHQVTGDEEWLVLAGILIDVAVQHFADDEGGFYAVADDVTGLIQRPRDATDNAEPSAWTALANACLTQSALTGVPDYRTIAERALGIVTTIGPRSPRAMGWGLASACAVLAGPLEVGLVADAGDDTLGRWWWTALMGTSPGLVVSAGAPDDAPLLRDRPVLSAQPTAYVCRSFTCERPITDMSDLVRRISVRTGALEG